MSKSLHLTTFDQVDLDDPLFTSLKAQYVEFSDWFERKAEERAPAYIAKDEADQLIGFVYLKVETSSITDVTPNLPAAKRLKVGTFKIIAHGTKLGERVIKKIFDHAVEGRVQEIYVTVFDTHAKLIQLFERYGFKQIGVKETVNGTELVLLRSLESHAMHRRASYPFVHTRNASFYLLAIYPEYHTKLFPDSILKTEDASIVQDVSFTNTIHKVYIAKLALTRMVPGDIVVIYRTTDQEGRARYRSVATSICVVEEVRSRADFNNVDEFLKFALPHSVFTEKELRDWYGSRDRLFAVRMMYNVALKKRPIRDTLLEDVGISEHPQWDLRKLSREQFDRIIELGSIDESLIID